MNTSPVNYRNLERIQEQGIVSTHRLATLLLATGGIAAIVVAIVASSERQEGTASTTVDPLSILVAEAGELKHTPVAIRAGDLNFPDLLSDAQRKTTALVAVKDIKGRLIATDSTIEKPALPERVAAEPLPAGDVLRARTLNQSPKDDLTQLAIRSTANGDVILAEPGAEGAYVVQVASFKEQADAERFVHELRERGHKAFREAANVPGRGLWHRVRIGPFTTKYRALLYKKKLEAKERMTALVIDRQKVERNEKVRATQLAERIRKYGAQ